MKSSKSFSAVTTAAPEFSTETTKPAPSPNEALDQVFFQELASSVKTKASVRAVANRIAREVERICEKSDRIQRSGDVRGWQLALGRHRLEKCLGYYRLGSTRGRVDLHSTLSTMVYRHIAPMRARLGFQWR